MIVIPEGDLVASTVPYFKEKLKEAVETGSKEVTVEMGNVRMIDSMGITVLIAAQNTLEKNSGKLKLLNVENEIYLMMKLMRLDKHMEIVPA